MDDLSSNAGTTEETVYCGDDTQPDNVQRCYLKEFEVDTKKCEDLSYEECINAVATDYNGGCAFLVTENCFGTCGRCVSIPIPCADYKTCNDLEVSDTNGKGGYTNTYYCGDEDSAPVLDCNRCAAADVDTCLKDEHCAWNQFKSLDYRCGWCSNVCDSCEDEKTRVSDRYDSGEYFNGGKYEVICATDDEKLLKECRKCYGKKSECAGAFCASEVKACNADKECSDAAFPVFCVDFKEDEGSIFYEKFVNGHSDNEAVVNLAKCMKKGCFENTDDEITYEYDSQTSPPPCDYATVVASFDICLKDTTVSDLCEVNYAVRFRENVCDTGRTASIVWTFLGDDCKIFASDKDRRMMQSDNYYYYGEEPKEKTTENPVLKEIKSTQIPDDIPTSLNCISVDIKIVYFDQETFKADKEKFVNIQTKAQYIYPGATVSSTYTIDCCKEDEVCQDMSSSSVGTTFLLGMIGAVVTLLFV
jgi:hypothetical protein